MRAASILASALSLVVGAVIGAALQRWGDGVRASGHLGTATLHPSPWVRQTRTWGSGLEVYVEDDDG